MSPTFESLYPNDGLYNDLLEDAEHPDLDFQTTLLLDALRGNRPSDTLNTIRKYLCEKVKKLLADACGTHDDKQSDSELCLPGDDHFDDLAKRAGFDLSRTNTHTLEEQIQKVLARLKDPKNSLSLSSVFHEDLLRTLYVLLMRKDTLRSVLGAVFCSLELEKQHREDGRDLRTAAAQRLQELSIPQRQESLTTPKPKRGHD